MKLADRLNRIIEERQISKAEFARRIGVTPQYVLLLTGNAKARPESIKPALAKLIALEFDCDYEWLLHGKEPKNKPTINVHTCEGPLRTYGLSVKENETVLKYADGMTVKQIAEDTGVTVNTVNYYLRNAYRKLNVHSRQELAALLNESDLTAKKENPALAKLNPKQRKMVELLCLGYTAKEIAPKINLSEHTVKDYMKVIYRVFEVHSRLELVALMNNFPLPPKK